MVVGHGHSGRRGQVGLCTVLGLCKGGRVSGCCGRCSEGGEVVRAGPVGEDWGKSAGEIVKGKSSSVAADFGQPACGCCVEARGQ